MFLADEEMKEWIARRADAVTAARLLATWQDVPACDLDVWDAPPAGEGTQTTVLAAERARGDPGTLAR